MGVLQRLRIWTAALLMVASLGGVTASLATPATAAAAGCDKYFLTIPPWYRGLAEGPDCAIKSPGKTTSELQRFIWTIVLNIVEIMLHLVGYVTIFFIIFGGFKYMTSAGSSDGMSKAKTTIMNAVIGLVLSIMSIAIVNLVAGAIQ